MVNQTEKKLPGWAVFLMLLFYPVGALYLIYRILVNNFDSKNELLKNSLLFAGSSSLTILFGMVIYWSDVSGRIIYSDPSERLIMIPTMLVMSYIGGVVLLILSERYRRLGNIYQKYAAVITSGKVEKISQIASEVGISCDEARSDLEKLIIANALGGRYIDKEKDILVWPGKPVVKQIPRVTKSCPHCGGKNEIPVGQAMNCEYCDSLIR